MNKTIAIIGLSLAGLFSGVAMAADAVPAADGGGAMAACKADFEKLCPGVQPGEGRLKACLKEKRRQISPECKKELAAARKAKKG
jgi:hypothetical protein